MHPCPTVSKLKGDRSVNRLIAHLGLRTWKSHQKHWHNVGPIAKVHTSVHGGMGSSAAVNTEQLHWITQLCWLSPLRQRTVLGSLDIEVSGNSKKQQTALERKGLTCTSACGWSELWLGGSINHFVLASYSLCCATLVLSLWPKAVYFYWLSQKPEGSFQVSFLCSLCF